MFWDTRPRDLVEVNQFWEEYTAPSSGPKSKIRKQQAERFIFDPKFGGSVLLQKVGKLLPDYLFRFQKTKHFTVIAMRTSNFMKIYYMYY